MIVVTLPTSPGFAVVLPPMRMSDQKTGALHACHRVAASKQHTTSMTT